MTATLQDRYPFSAMVGQSITQTPTGRFGYDSIYVSALAQTFKLALLDSIYCTSTLPVAGGAICWVYEVGPPAEEEKVNFLDETNCFAFSIENISRAAYSRTLPRQAANRSMVRTGSF